MANPPTRAPALDAMTEDERAEARTHLRQAIALMTAATNQAREAIYVSDHTALLTRCAVSAEEAMQLALNEITEVFQLVAKPEARHAE